MMTPEQFTQRLNALQPELEAYISHTLPRLAGQLAVNHFRLAFDEQGFTDRTYQRWPEVKRRTDPRFRGRAASRRPILTGSTGFLAESIRAITSNGTATIVNDMPYADAHNYGTNTAGRNRNITIPQRQFIGPSEVLNQQITAAITADIIKMLNTL